ncbi:MAG: DUF349 domain-containing protein [Bacteroidota bacterium]
MKNYQDYGYTKDGKVYLKGYNDLPDREVGVVKESEEASLQYFADRYDNLIQKVEEMESDIEDSQNKGSYLMKLVHLRDSLADYNAIGDFPAVIERLNKMEAFIKDYIEQNRTKNLDIKQALLQEAHELVSGEDWEDIADKLKDLKIRWIRTGSTHQEEALCEEFDNLLDDFFERRKDHYERLKELTNKRMRQYRDLIRALKDVNNKKTKDSEDRAAVINIQRDWKDVGRINKWRYLKLWKKYKREVDIFFGNEIDEEEETPQRSSRIQPRMDAAPRRRIPVEGRERERRPVESPSRKVFSSEKLSPSQTIERKTELCEDVEEMLNGNIHNVSLDAVKERQMEWRNLGMIQNDESDKELNIRFRSVCNEIFEHYNLYKVVRNRVDDFVNKTQFEQLKIKIKMIRDIIKQEENELSRMTPPPRQGDPRDRSRMQYINKVNKVKTQKRMLRKMQNELDGAFY